MKKRVNLFVLGCALLTCSIARAQSITFETTPSGSTPVDDAFLSTAYPMTGGTVAFFFDFNGNFLFDSAGERAVFERAGDADPNSGFTNSFLGADDTAQAGFEPQLGTYFLRQLQPGAPPPAFIVDYNTTFTISGLHGEIWDIDGAVGNTEQWRVEVLDASNNVLTFLDSPLGDNQSLDGLPWDFSFSGLPAGVDKLRITFTGSKESGLGLAFNNFDPTNPAPEPGTTILVFAGAYGLLARGRERTRS